MVDLPNLDRFLDEAHDLEPVDRVILGFFYARLVDA
jgi:hypothetical protein